MEFNSLKRKRIVDDKLVMTEPTLVFKEGASVFQKHIVEDDEEGRPDLISLTYYNDDSMTDLILKWNGISNPFSMNAGDEIEIPLYTEDFVKFIKPTRNTGSSKKDKFVSQRRMTKKDIKRLEFLQQKSAQLPNGSKENLPPNRLKTGEANWSVDYTTRKGNPTNFTE